MNTTAFSMVSISNRTIADTQLINPLGGGDYIVSDANYSGDFSRYQGLNLIDVEARDTFLANYNSPNISLVLTISTLSQFFGRNNEIMVIVENIGTPAAALIRLLSFSQSTYDQLSANGNNSSVRHACFIVEKGLIFGANQLPFPPNAFGSAGTSATDCEIAIGKDEDGQHCIIINASDSNGNMQSATGFPPGLGTKIPPRI